MFLGEWGDNRRALGGGETRLGKTSWQSIDSTAIGAVSAEALKHSPDRSNEDQASNELREMFGIPLSFNMNKSAEARVYL